MFLNRTATVKRRTYDANRVSTRSTLLTITCKLSPLTGDDINLTGGADFEGIRMYCRERTLQQGDIVTVGSETLSIVKRLEHVGTLRSYAVYICKRAQGD